MTRIACFAAVLGALSSPAVCQIYKCVDADGNVTYQESACPRGARGGPLPLDATSASPASASGAVASGRSTAPVTLAAARQPSMADIERDVRRMELERRKRAIGFDIDALERGIRGNQESLDRELREMREQQARATANPFEPGLPNPTAADMLAVSQRYQGMIATAQDRIFALREEARRLDASPIR